MADTVTLAGREFPVAPLNLRTVRQLMAGGQFEQFQRFEMLKPEEQLDMMVAVIAAAFRVEPEWLWDNLTVVDFEQIPAAFNAIMSRDKKEVSGPKAASP
jgi:hypothetical protein